MRVAVKQAKGVPIQAKLLITHDTFSYHRITALVMIDLDGLKHINDTYGHEFGDK